MNPTQTQEEIIDRLNELRKIKGMTLTQLADRSVLTQPYLSAVFRHKYNPQLDTILRIMAALDAKFYIYC